MVHQTQNAQSIMVDSLIAEPMTIEPQAIPLRVSEGGAIRVGTTRVLIDLVVGAFEEGCTPEEIIERYSALNVADVYLVIGYYLHHREQVQAYVAQREQEAEEMRRQIEAQPGHREWRAQLLARKAERE